MSWLKRKATKSSTGVCDCCGAPLEPGAGYWLSTRKIVLSRAYWQRVFTKAAGTATRTGAVLARQGVAGPDLDVATFDVPFQLAVDQSEPWAVCESCAELFVFDREGARAYAKQRTAPPDSGPVNAGEYVLHAAIGWTAAFGSWPANVQRVEPTDRCDLCESPLYPLETRFTVPSAKLDEYLATRALDHEPASARADGSRVACSACMGRILARVEGP